MSLLACGGGFGVILAPLFPYDGDFVATLGPLGGHFWHVRAALGALLGYFGVTWGALAAYGVTLGPLLRHLKVTLVSLWGQLGVSLGICG